MGDTIYHFRIDVEGALKNFRAHEWRDCVKDDSGRLMSPIEVRSEFDRLLAEGTKFIPVGSCDNFDPERGCRGHKANGEGNDVQDVA